MEFEELKEDIIALRKLYGLLEVNECVLQNMTSKNLDERARLLLRSLLDGAAQNLFEQFTKTDQAPVSITPATPKPHPCHRFTPLHSSAEASNYKPPGFCPSDQRSRLPEDDAPTRPSQKGIISRHSKEEGRGHFTSQYMMKEDSSLQYRGHGPYSPAKEPPSYHPECRKSYSSAVPGEAGIGRGRRRPPPPPVFSRSISEEGSWDSSSSVGEEDSLSGTSNGGSESESSGSYQRSGGGRSSGFSRSEGRKDRNSSRGSSVYQTDSGYSKKKKKKKKKFIPEVRRRKKKLSFSRSREGRSSGFSVSEGRKGTSRSSSSYQTGGSGYWKKPFGRLRKLRNKLALVFHHHHHHHHHHGSTQGKRKEKQGKEVEEMAAAQCARKKAREKRNGGKEKGDFVALVEGLKRHVRRRKKKKPKRPKLQKGKNGSVKQLRWWKRFQKNRGGRGGRAVKGTRHELLGE